MPIAFSEVIQFSTYPCNDPFYANITANITYLNDCGEDLFVIIGGTDGVNFSNNVYYYVPSTGSTGIAGSANLYNGIDPDLLRIAGHTGIIVSKYIIMVGGFQKSLGAAYPSFSQSIFMFDLNEQIWVQVNTKSTPTSLDLPLLAFASSVGYCSSRFGSQCQNNTDVEAEIWIYGGINSDGTVNGNLYVLHVNFVTFTYNVILVEDSSTIPLTPTFGAAYSNDGDYIYYYGGASLPTNTSLFPLSTGGVAVIGQDFVPLLEFWTYNIPLGTWENRTQIHPSILTRLGPIIVVYNDFAFFFGGEFADFTISSGVYSVSLIDMSVSTFGGCCSPGYTGYDCSNPICQTSCGGPNMGKCVAPNQCQCINGFTGPDCSVHPCQSSYGVDLFTLLPSVFYPAAAKNTQDKIKQLLQRFQFLQSNLRDPENRMLRVPYQVGAQTTYNFNTGPLSQISNDVANQIKELTKL